MWLLHLAITLVLYTFGPGLLIVRAFRLSPAERLCVAIAAGLFVNFLLSFTIFALGLPTVAHVAVSIMNVVLLMVGLRDRWRLLRNHQVRRMIAVWLSLLVWGLLLVSMVRYYAGGTWGGDWQEHYERTRFLQGGVNYGHLFIDQYPFPMRPPMANALSAAVMAQTLDYSQINNPDLNLGYPDYEAFQLTFVFFNALVVLPCVLLVGRLVKLPPRLARKVPWTLAAVLAASPMFSQNLAYAWTKLFAAFFALLAIALYLRAWRRRKDEGGRMKDETRGLAAASASSFILPPSSLRFTLAFAFLCVGFLVHFSVGPYGLFLGLHYLVALWWKRPKKWLEAGLIGGVSAAVLASWFAWSTVHYGAKTTFGSTSAVSDSVKMTPAENAVNIAKNLGNTLLPPIVRNPGWIFDPPIPTPEGKATVDQETRLDLENFSTAGKVRDFFFLIYQVTLPGGLGLVGCGFVVWFIVRAFRGKTRSDQPVRRFWVAFTIVVYLAGTAVYGGVDRFGVAHICLQPLILVGLCLLAGGIWTVPVRARGILLTGLLLDFVLGVFLQGTLQHQVFPMKEHTAQTADGVRFVIAYEPIAGPDVPSRAGQHNYRVKLSGKFAFWGDHFADALPALQFALGGMLAFLLFKGLLGPRRRFATVVQRPTTIRPRDPRYKRRR